MLYQSTYVLRLVQYTCIWGSVFINKSDGRNETFQRYAAEQKAASMLVAAGVAASHHVAHSSLDMTNFGSSRPRDCGRRAFRM